MANKVSQTIFVFGRILELRNQLLKNSDSKNEFIVPRLILSLQTWGVGLPAQIFVSEVSFEMEQIDQAAVGTPRLNQKCQDVNSRI